MISTATVGERSQIRQNLFDFFFPNTNTMNDRAQCNQSGPI